LLATELSSCSAWMKSRMTAAAGRRTPDESIHGRHIYREDICYRLEPQRTTKIEGERAETESSSPQGHVRARKEQRMTGGCDFAGDARRPEDEEDDHALYSWQLEEEMAADGQEERGD
jgi:hypothetical protein